MPITSVVLTICSTKLDASLCLPSNCSLSSHSLPVAYLALKSKTLFHLLTTSQVTIFAFSTTIKLIKKEKYSPCPFPFFQLTIPLSLFKKTAPWLLPIIPSVRNLFWWMCPSHCPNYVIWIYIKKSVFIFNFSPQPHLQLCIWHLHIDLKLNKYILFHVTYVLLQQKETLIYFRKSRFKLWNFQLMTPNTE